MKLSIIIPVYNVEKYIEKCILSCCNQNLDTLDYEIIIVNDGSPDKSLEIASRLEQLYSNIVIISQTNQGLSAARNKGLNSAKGEYVWFVDSDDWVKENCFLEIYNKCLGLDLDVLLFGANDCDDYICIKRCLPFNDSKIPVDGKSFLLTNEIVFPVCFKVFKRDFLINNNLYFLKDIMHEDNEFIPRVLYFSDKVFCISDIFYNVYNNPKSITRSINPKKSFDLIKVAQAHADFMNGNVHEDTLKVKFSNFIGLAINSALDNIKLMDRKNENIFYFELKKNKHLFYYIKRSNNIKYKLEAKLFLFSPELFKRFYSIYSKLN